jgi:hypothetical protein
MHASHSVSWNILDGRILGLGGLLQARYAQAEIDCSETKSPLPLEKAIPDTAPLAMRTRKSADHVNVPVFRYQNVNSGKISTFMNLARVNLMQVQAAVKDRTPVTIPDDTCPCREACSPLSDPTEEETISKVSRRSQEK